MPTDLTPAARHEQLVSEIRRRLEVCEAQDEGPWAWSFYGEKEPGYIVGAACDKDGRALSGYVEDDDDIVEPVLYLGEGHAMNSGNAAGISAQRTERPRELRALLEIVVRHREFDESEYECGSGCCRQCGDTWPCADFLSAEKILIAEVKRAE